MCGLFGRAGIRKFFFHHSYYKDVIEILFSLMVLFIIPWILGIYLIQRDNKLLIMYGPIASAIAFIHNEIGLHFEWWSLHPKDMELMIALISNIGVYPVSGCFMLYFLRQNKAYLSVFIFAAILTTLVYTFSLLNKVQFHHGWNIGWTFLSYLTANTLLYFYYLLYQNKVKIAR